MTSSTDITPLEPSTTWIVFVLSALVHSVTFIFLENMSDRFKDYINLCKGSDRKRHTEVIHQSTPDGDKMPSETVSEFRLPSRNFGTSSRFWKLNANSLTHEAPHTAISHLGAAYTPLHDTLDVSVFR